MHKKVISISSSQQQILHKHVTIYRDSFDVSGSSELIRTSSALALQPTVIGPGLIIPIAIEGVVTCVSGGVAAWLLCGRKGSTCNVRGALSLNHDDKTYDKAVDKKENAFTRDLERLKTLYQMQDAAFLLKGKGLALFSAASFFSMVINAVLVHYENDNTLPSNQMCLGLGALQTLNEVLFTAATIYTMGGENSFRKIAAPFVKKPKPAKGAQANNDETAPKTPLDEVVDMMNRHATHGEPVHEMERQQRGKVKKVMGAMSYSQSFNMEINAFNALFALAKIAVFWKMALIRMVNQSLSYTISHDSMPPSMTEKRGCASGKSTLNNEA